MIMKNLSKLATVLRNSTYENVKKSLLKYCKDQTKVKSKLCA